LGQGKLVTCLTATLLLVCCSHQKNIVVGSKNFTEQTILGEIAAQHLERRLGQPVKRKLGLGGTLLAHQALSSGEIDLYPEYTGTAFTNVMKHEPISDPAAVLDRLRSDYRAMKLQWLDPLGFNNSFAMVIRGDDARNRRLGSLSDAASDKNGFRLGAGYEFLSRPDGFGLLNASYGLKWNGRPTSMDLGLLYTALNDKQVDMVAGAATDGVLSVLDVTILADDKKVFPPYQACLVVRSEALADHPNLRAILSELSGRISTEAMQRMNYDVDGKHRQPADVAREFLNRLDGPQP